MEKLGLKLVFWKSISSHTHAFLFLIFMLWGKFSKIRLFFKKKKKKLFFQNFNWSNLIFDQSKSFWKISVSLCLVRLIEPVFRSIEHRESSFFFFKIVFWLIQNTFSNLFQTFLSLFDLARLHWRFFVVFQPNFCKVFLSQGR